MTTVTIFQLMSRWILKIHASKMSLSCRIIDNRNCSFITVGNFFMTSLKKVIRFLYFIPETVITLPEIYHYFVHRSLDFSFFCWTFLRMKNRRKIDATVLYVIISLKKGYQNVERLTGDISQNVKDSSKTKSLTENRGHVNRVNDFTHSYVKFTYRKSLLRFQNCKEFNLYTFFTKYLILKLK